MAKCAMREASGLLFECPSPSVWYLVGQPVVIAFDGNMWLLSFTTNKNHHEEYFHDRDEAIKVIAWAYSQEDAR